MKREFSVFLDGARLLAAILVVASHTEWTFAPGFLPFLKTNHLGTLAVGVFFVLSGFVIAYVVDQKEENAKDYFVARAARIYSVAVPAMILTLLFDALGQWLAPAAYATSLSPLSLAKEAARLLISLTFVNGVWGWHMTPGSDVPFWSLTYEVPYYLTFGLWHFGGRKLCVAAVVVLAATGPLIAFLFVIWLLGFASYHVCRRARLSRLQGRLLAAIGCTLLCCAPYFATFFSEAAPFSGRMYDSIQFFLAGVPFAIAAIGMWFAELSFHRIGPAIQWAAGATFTLYLVHFPLGFFLHAIVPRDWSLAVRWLGIFFFLIAACFVVAEFTERSKTAWRSFFLELLKKLGAAAQPLISRSRSAAS